MSVQYTISRMRRKLAPLEDRGFTEEILPLLRNIDLSDYARRYKRGDYIVITPLEMWELLFSTAPSTRDLAKLGRSLQGLLWERSYLNGTLIFCKPLQEYYQDGL